MCIYLNPDHLVTLDKDSFEKGQILWILTVGVSTSLLENIKEHKIR